MPSNDLAAAVERLRRVQNGEGVPEYDAHQNLIGGVLCRDYLNDLMATSDAYLARESDDAKPVDREWLVSVLGEPQTNYDHHARWAHKVEEGEFVIYEFEGEAWCFIPCEDSLSDGSRTGEEVVRFLPDRGDVRAFLRLARWPTNENGGE